MYLNSVRIEKYRKIKKSQEIEFAHDLKQSDKNSEINISTDTTLIVGKNNSGKTSIITALLKFTESQAFKPTDFNFQYLSYLLENYKLGNYKELPTISCDLIIGSDNPEKDRTTNFYQFMRMDADAGSDLCLENHKLYTIYAIYEPKNVQFLRNDLENINHDSNLEELLEIISNNEFELNFYNESKKIVKKFSLKKLIEIEFIEANQIKREDILTTSFNKIFNHNIEQNIPADEKVKINRLINEFNTDMGRKANDNVAESAKKSLGEMIHTSNMDMVLSGNLQFEDLFNKVIQYSYLENGIKIPETQFGLGYTNLMVIVTKILDYLEVYQDRAFNSKINILAIEEPEAFMHPQMQELLIKNINNIINSILETNNKDIRVQIVITTHSSHVLNSKIQSSQSFDKINYLTTINGMIESIALSNKIVMPSEVESELHFLLKHIRYHASELFFSDAVILVEGPTEETLIRYFIDNVVDYDELRKFYITIFNIDGAHAKVYESLLKVLKIPTLTITDLDIKNSTKSIEPKNTDDNLLNDESESKPKKNLNQVLKITENMITTNSTLEHFIKTNRLIDICANNQESILFSDGNMAVVTQHKVIEGYYASSFEESLILTNYNNAVLNNALKKTKPNIWKSITEDGSELVNNKEKSYYWQNKLDGSKTKFANNLLYFLISSELVDNNDEKLLLPDYIKEGLLFLQNKLKNT